MVKSLLRLLHFAALSAALLFAGQMAWAQPADPAAAQIQRFDDALVATMKDGRAAGVQGRYKRLAPTVSAVFDLPAMTGFAVGPSWTTMPAAQRQALITAFTRFTVANYAHNFDSYGGQRFVIDPQIKTRGADKVVQTHMIDPNGAREDFSYRMRQDKGVWKVIDIYYGAISQLNMRRSEFTSPLATGGAPNLIKRLEAQSAKLMR